MKQPDAASEGNNEGEQADEKPHRLAIMQPYLFPYLGYFQLMHAVDTFAFYDNVTYIKRGWINRNRLLVNGAPWLFTLPLANASQNLLIKDLRLADSITTWRRKWLSSLAHAYGKAPHHSETKALIEPLVHNPSPWLIDWLDDSLRTLATALGLSTRFKRASSEPQPPAPDAQARILARCEQERATLYINPINGQRLYQAEAFAAQGLELRFLQTRTPVYHQLSDVFEPHLSIIDTLMCIGIDGTRALLPAYDLISHEQP
ncbi:MAG: WbqC family protein [Lamprobacter sp.]|uniref:WbqC family protein n=1 Tax=Lamprobacter sp. TaxID=3100796 RepID=UPI002B25BD56|nr:WbqC family protein [Lamprobacter sp.]MEA3642766.1 WbqC family protein [Lamprobacter sp.]